MKPIPFHKIITVGIFSLGYFAIALLLLFNSRANVDFTLRELAGLKYHHALVPLLGNPEKYEEADLIIGRNDEVQWLDLKVWEEVKHSIKDGKTEKALAKLRELMLDIGDKSNLILDPEIRSYYLMSMIVQIIPEMIDGARNVDTRLTLEHRKTLARAVDIINEGEENYIITSKVLQNGRADDAALYEDYYVAHDMLKMLLEYRLQGQQAMLVYNIAFIIAAYMVIMVLGWFAVRNHVAASEVRSAREKYKILERLEKSNSELEHFAYAASHDLKEPVRMVANFATLLERNCKAGLDDAGKSYISVITSSAKRIEQMIGDLLAYARLDDVTSDVALICDCNQGVQYALDNLRDVIEKKQGKIEKGELPKVNMQPVRFARLVQNIILNSLTYTEGDRHPEIKISAEHDGDFWRFEISDNGMGISSQYHKKIFEPFKRLHNDGNHEGTGIGLAICKKIVEKAGGKIWVESKLHKGSKFFFTLPCLPPSAGV